MKGNEHFTIRVNESIDGRLTIVLHAETAVLFIFCVLCCPLRAATLGPQSLVPAGHWIYDAVTRLYLEQGRSSFTGSAPLTAGELSLYLREIDYGKLSPAGRSAYDSVAAYLSREYPGFDSGLVSAGIQVEAALEGYFKICKDEIIAFGDSYNDIDMLSYAGLGVAMGNADDAVKKAADIIGRTNDEEGLRLVLEEAF